MSSGSIPEQRIVDAGIDTAEQYANRGTIVELDGPHLANTVALLSMRRWEYRRGVASTAVGQITVQHEIPLFLT